MCISPFFLDRTVNIYKGPIKLWGQLGGGADKMLDWALLTFLLDLQYAPSLWEVLVYGPA